MRPRHLALAVAAVALVVVVIIGVSQAPKTSAPSRSTFSLPAAQRALAGSPAPLAALHVQAAQLLGGGTSAFDARLKALRGRPVVVNKWASWCGPCRAEFPYLQDASTRFGKRVAFVGVNSGDSSSGAKDFMRRFPVPYPSYEDQRLNIAVKLRFAKAFPVTVFYDRTGKVVYTHAGYYLSQKALDADLERYLGVGGA